MWRKDRGMSGSKPKREYTPEERRKQRLWSQAGRAAMRDLASRNQDLFRELRAKHLRRLEEGATAPKAGGQHGE